MMNRNELGTLNVNTRQTDVLDSAANGSFLTKTTDLAGGRVTFAVTLPYGETLFYPAIAEQSAHNRFKFAAKSGR